MHHLTLVQLIAHIWAKFISISLALSQKKIENFVSVYIVNEPHIFDNVKSVIIVLYNVIKCGLVRHKAFVALKNLIHFFHLKKGKYANIYICFRFTGSVVY